jgi:hypothetical protein
MLHAPYVFPLQGEYKATEKYHASHAYTRHGYQNRRARPHLCERSTPPALNRDRKNFFGKIARVWYHLVERSGAKFWDEYTRTILVLGEVRRPNIYSHFNFTQNVTEQSTYEQISCWYHEQESTCKNINGWQDDCHHNSGNTTNH